MVYRKQNRFDPGSVFTSEEFKIICRQFQRKYIPCPVRDHRGNGKIEQMDELEHCLEKR